MHTSGMPVSDIRSLLLSSRSILQSHRASFDPVLAARGVQPILAHKMGGAESERAEGEGQIIRHTLDTR